MIGLYCPDLPPVPGGVADQTLMIARALTARGVACTVLGRRGDPALFPVPVRLGVAPPDVPDAARELGVTGMFVQYVPFLYARRGIEPRLCPALRNLARSRIKTALFVHEAFVPFTRLPWLVTGVFQRLQLRCLVRNVARVYAAVPRFADICRGYADRPDRVVLAPIGANFDVSTEPRAVARAALGLADGQVAIGVFSPAAAGYRVDWVRAAMRATTTLPGIRWLVYGFGSHRLFPSPPGHVTVLGEQNRDAVARVTRALDVFVAPYEDGLTLRRGGAMLGLLNTLPLVSSTGHLFDATLAPYAACEPDQESFVRTVERLATDAAAREAQAARARAGAALADVATLADRIVQDLAT